MTMTSTNGKVIVFQAGPYSFGPASIAIAVARQLREQSTNRLRLIALGQDTSYELFSSCDLFDEVRPFKMAHLKDEIHTVWATLQHAATIVSVLGFNFIKTVKAASSYTIFIDPLYWMWKKDPIRIDVCHRYFALDFPGVEGHFLSVQERVRQHAEIAPDDRLPIVVNPVRDNAAMAAYKNLPPKNTLVVNFGGLDLPGGYNLDLALTMARCILEVALKMDRHEKIYLCGGAIPIGEIAQALAPTDDRIEIRSFPQHEFFRQLAVCRDFITVPGLSIAFEALFFSKKTLFMLPLNDTQHQQPKAYLYTLDHCHCIRWEDVGAYQTLSGRRLRQKGGRSSFAMGKRFGRDEAAQGTFKSMVEAFLQGSQGDGLHAGLHQSTWKFDGAEQIAAQILVALTA